MGRLTSWFVRKLWVTWEHLRRSAVCTLECTKLGRIGNVWKASDFNRMEAPCNCDLYWKPCVLMFEGSERLGPIWGALHAICENNSISRDSRTSWWTQDIFCSDYLKNRALRHRHHHQCKILPWRWNRRFGHTYYLQRIHKYRGSDNTWRCWWKSTNQSCSCKLKGWSKTYSSKVGALPPPTSIAESVAAEIFWDWRALDNVPRSRHVDFGQMSAPLTLHKISGAE